MAIRLNHTMCDAFGMCQFLNTMGEMAQGIKHPSVPPVWQRELLNARNPQELTRKHHGSEDQVDDDQLNLNTTNMVHCSFVFNDNHITAIRKTLPPHLALLSIRVTNSLSMEMSDACTKSRPGKGCTSYMHIQWTTQEHSWFKSPIRVLWQCSCLPSCSLQGWRLVQKSIGICGGVGEEGQVDNEC